MMTMIYDRYHASGKANKRMKLLADAFEENEFSLHFAKERVRGMWDIVVKVPGDEFKSFDELASYIRKRVIATKQAQRKV